MSSRSFLLDESLTAYVDAHCPPLDDVQQALIAATEERASSAAAMRLGTSAAAFLGLLTRLVAPRFAVEVGTFTGYSALAIARALPDDGRLLCCDVSEEWTSIAREHWEMAGLGDRIDLRIGPALDTLRELPPDVTVDLAFIDADKDRYVDYYEELVPRLGPRGVIVADNVLWDGLVADDGRTDPTTVALRGFNDHVTDDPRTNAVLAPLGDGLMLIDRAG